MCYRVDLYTTSVTDLPYASKLFDGEPLQVDETLQIAPDRDDWRDAVAVVTSVEPGDDPLVADVTTILKATTEWDDEQTYNAANVGLWRRHRPAVPGQTPDAD